MQRRLLITTKQLQTHSAKAKGPSQCRPVRAQAPQCGEATGGPLCSSQPSVYSHATRPPLKPSAPAASSSFQAEIAGWQGNRVCKYDHTDKEMSRSPFSRAGTWGREVCLFRSLHTMSGPRQEGEEKKAVTFKRVQRGDTKGGCCSISWDPLRNKLLRNVFEALKKVTQGR